MVKTPKRGTYVDKMQPEYSQWVMTGWGGGVTAMTETANSNSPMREGLLLVPS